MPIARWATEQVAIDDALGRVLAQDVAAAGDVPPFPCSAMDGYAVIAGDAGRTLRIVGESRAGTPSEHELAEGEAIRISTGAAVPPGADGGDPPGERELNGGDVDPHQRRGRRPASTSAAPARTCAPRTIVLSAGTALGPVALGAAVAAGVGSVIVARRPRVACCAPATSCGHPASRSAPARSTTPTPRC